MKKLLKVLILILCSSNVFPQDYDLVVTQKGDSIACHIDSITDAVIYFEMKYNNKWTNTHMNRDKVKEFKYNAIDKKAFIFKSGTSYILREMKPPSSQYDIPKNMLILASDFLFSLTLSYERLIPIHEKIGFMLRGGSGITWESGKELVIMGQASMLYGRSKHFLETGVGYYQTFNFNPSFFPLVGYRYMGLKGLTIKLFMNAEYYTDEDWIDEWGQSMLSSE